MICVPVTDSLSHTDSDPHPHQTQPPPKMQDKPKASSFRRRRTTMKFHFLCIPTLTTTTTTSAAAATNTTRRGSPMTSLLDRLREAVFRLIMLSALSKATANDQGGGGGSGEARHHHRSYHRPVYEAYDHSEAVADCIEFIKRSATAEDNRSSTASSCVDGSPEMAIRKVLI